MLRLRKRPEPDINELQRLAKEFHHAIDAMWLHSDAAFDALHGVAPPGCAPIQDPLKSALHSRSGSLQLYKVCCNEPIDCLLELNLRPKSDLTVGLRGYDDSSHLYYRLFARTPNSSQQLQKLEVEYLPGTGAVDAKPSDVIDRIDSGFQLFKSRSHDESIIIPAEGEGTSLSSLHIKKQSLEYVEIYSEPKSLISLFEDLKGKSVMYNKGRLSVGAKIALAYKIVESSFFLLGTPWLMTLSSRCLLLLQDTKHERPRFILRIQANDLIDILWENREDLSEKKPTL